VNFYLLIWITNIYKYITAWSRILPEKLIVNQLVKKCPVLYGTPSFITVFARARHWYVS